MARFATHSPLMRRLARRYVWWKSPREALRRPDHVVARTMDLGDYDDVFDLIENAGEARLRRVIRAAEPGLFSPRSWSYWHYRLGLDRGGRVPPLPKRPTA